MNTIFSSFISAASAQRIALSLHDAMQEGCLERVKLYLDSQNINQTSGIFDDTPLMRAVRWALLDANANRDALDHRGNTALMCAIQSRNVDAVNVLLQSAKDVNAANGDRVTALMMASRDGQLDIVNALLHAGARINMVDGYNRSVLMQATGKEVIAVLQAAKAQLDAAIGSGSMADIAFVSAAVGGNADAGDAPMLPGNGAAAANANGLAALSEAARFGRIEPISGLIKGMRPEPGTTAALYDPQMRSAVKDGQIEMIQALVKFGGVFIHDYLLLAVRDANAWAVANLLTAGANANFEFASKTTALMLAAHWGHVDVVKSLLEAGADANAASTDGHTALLCAVNSGNVQIVDILIAAKANIDVKYADHTLPMIAVLRGQAGMVQKPIQAHGEPEAMNEMLLAVLKFAAQHGQMKIVEVLLAGKEATGASVQHGADAGAAMQDIPAAASAAARQALAPELHSFAPRDERIKSDGMLMPACSPELERALDGICMLSASDATRGVPAAEHGVQLAADSPQWSYPFA